MFDSKMSSAYCHLSSTSFSSSSLATLSSFDLLKNITVATNNTEEYQQNNYLNFLLNDYWIKESDQRMVEFPLLGAGPQTLLVIMASYFAFVTVIGPKLMSKREPFVLRGPMMAYNLLMVVFNAYFFVKFISLSDYGREYLKSEFPSNTDRSYKTLIVINTVYYYFLTKFVDLLDTVFFVLRKKNNQITGLHLYHHTIVPILAWIGCKISPTVPAYQIFAILNSSVHVIMYSYYGLSAFGPRMQKYLWWKKYITQIQLIQFIILIAYGCTLAMVQTNYPRVWFWMVFVQSPLFFLMFFDFYLQSYRKSRRAAA